MKMTTTLQRKSDPKLTPVTINRLETVEEELTDRILRVKNGESILMFCRKLAVVLSAISAENRDVERLQDRLRASLESNLGCTPIQAVSLIELSLEFVYARLHGRYRRPNVDLGLLVSTAAGAVRERRPRNS